MENTGLDERQAIGILQLMVGKYQLEMWAPNFQVAIANQNVQQHVWYACRRNKISTTMEEAPVILQQAIDVAQPVMHPKEDVLEIGYNDSGLYDFQNGQPAPGTTGTYRVLKKGIYATMGNRLRSIKRAVVSPA
jgi:hypothetical protein